MQLLKLFRTLLETWSSDILTALIHQQNVQFQRVSLAHGTLAVCAYFNPCGSTPKLRAGPTDTLYSWYGEAVSFSTSTSPSLKVSLI